jgi:DNA-binding NarL/FixJ family response regulator
MAKFKLLTVFHGLSDSISINFNGVFYAVIYLGGFFMKQQSIVIGTSSVFYARLMKKWLGAVCRYEIIPVFAEGELRQIVAERKPYLLFMDSRAWGNATHYMVALLKHRHPKLRIAMFSFEALTLKEAARFVYFGASGMVNFRFDKHARKAGLARLVRGEDYIPPVVAKAFEKYEFQREADPALTMRETEIYDLYLEGKNETDIARKLRVSANTVKNHKQHIYKKLGVTNNSELFRFALDKRDITQAGLLAGFEGKYAA